MLGRRDEGTLYRLQTWPPTLLRAAFGARRADAFGILVYHRVWSGPSQTRPLHAVSAARFEHQIAGLLRLGYTPWTLDRVLRTLDEGDEIPARTFVITFDDGYADNHDAAWPILRAQGAPATVFLTTAYLDGDAAFPFADRTGLPLSTAQCDAMLADGLIAFGAHTHTHEDFRDRPDDLARDLEANLTVLRERFEIERPAFAFPFGRRATGHSGAALTDVVRRAGVTCGLTTENERAWADRDRFAWGRFHASEADTASTLAAKFDGWYEFIRATARAFTPTRGAACR